MTLEQNMFTELIPADKRRIGMRLVRYEPCAPCKRVTQQQLDIARCALLGATMLRVQPHSESEEP